MSIGVAFVTACERLDTVSKMANYPSSRIRLIATALLPIYEQEVIDRGEELVGPRQKPNPPAAIAGAR